MNLLAIDSATEHCSVALRCEDQLLFREKTEPRGHGRLLLPWIAELLSEAGIDYSQLDAIAVDRGPGGFTSLRLGLSIAQGIALAHDLPIHPVSSLAALAMNGRPEENGQAFRGKLLAAMDARMGEIYAAWFDFSEDFPKLIGKELLCAPSDLPIDYKNAAAAGNAFEVYAESLGEKLDSFSQAINTKAYPSAMAIAALASSVKAVNAGDLQPVYLRDNVAHQKQNKSR